MQEHFTPLGVYNHVILPAGMKRWAPRLLILFATYLIGAAITSIFMFDQSLQYVRQGENLQLPSSTLVTSETPHGATFEEVGHLAEEFVEHFIDEKKIGKPQHNKVEMRCVNRDDRTSAELTFFTKTQPKSWEQKQSFKFENYQLMGCSPYVADFNNDGFGDLTFVSGQAARGANEIRTLFIYDRKTDSFVHIKNSSSYPNLGYNATLKCIDSLMFHGATTTVFLRIRGDELVDFARVDTGSDLSVRVLGRDGWHETYRRSMSEEDIYTRYTTFDPPRP